MDRWTKASGIALIVLLALSTPAIAQVNVDGEWTLSIESPSEVMNARAVFEQDDQSFSGRVSYDGEGSNFTGGTISGNSIAFLFEIDDVGEIMSVEVEAQVDGDEMTGEISVVSVGGDQPFSMTMPFTGTRGGLPD